MDAAPVASRSHLSLAAVTIALLAAACATPSKDTGRTGAGGSGGQSASGSGGSAEAGSGGVTGTGGKAGGGAGGTAGNGNGGQPSTGGTGGTPGTGGSGGSSCKSLWSADVSPAKPADVVLDGNTLYAVGLEGTKGWVAAFSTCDGTKLHEQLVAPPQGLSQAAFQGVAMAGNALYAEGDTLPPTNGTSSVALLARFNPTTLALSSGFPKTLGATNGVDETFSIAAATSGSLWIAGSTNGQSQTWGIKASEAGQMCGFSIGSTPGSSHSVVADGNTLYFVDREGGKLVLHRFSDASCSAVSPCNCTPSWSSQPFAVQAPGGGTATNTTGFGVSVVSGVAYVSGYAQTTTNIDSAFGFVAAISLSTGNVVGTPYTYNPSNYMDGFLAQAIDGSELYVAGGSNYALNNNAGTSRVLVLNVSSTSPSLLRSLKLPLAGLATGIAVEPAGGDGAYVAVSAPISGGAQRVVRCRKDGTCP